MSNINSYPTQYPQQQPMNQNNYGIGNAQIDKERVKEIYKKVLGREGSESDINYIVNLKIEEKELIKRMVDSQEHMELVKAKQEVYEAKRKVEEAEQNAKDVTQKSADVIKVNERYDLVVAEKNHKLDELKSEVARLQNQVRLLEIKLSNEETRRNRRKKNIFERVYGIFFSRL